MLPPNIASIRKIDVRHKTTRTPSDPSAFQSINANISIGNRICIYGQGGKTSLSRALGDVTGLPVIELDAISWLPNWVERDRDEVLKIVIDQVTSATDGWIVDGNHSKIRPHLLPLADTVIWLNLPRIPSTLRVAKRTLSNAINKTQICGENYETLKTALSPDSIIWYRAFHGQKSQHGIAVDLSDPKTRATVYQIRSYRQLRTFYQSLGLDPRRHLT